MATIAAVAVDTSNLTAGFRLRATPEEVEAWQSAAAEEGLSVAAWIRARATSDPTVTDALRAHRKVAKALEEGTIERAPCEECGTEAEAHHDDYSKPLAVRWLCRKHHRQWHVKNPSGVAWGLVTFRVDEATQARWKAAATARGCSVAVLVRDAVEASLDAPRGKSAARAPQAPHVPTGNLATKFRPDFKTGTKK